MQILNYQNVLILGTTQESIKFFTIKFDCSVSICPLNPTNEFMVVMRKKKVLDLYRIATGEKVSVITNYYSIS